MKFNISFFLIIVNFSLLNSQYTETINSNRPGSSHGAFSIGKNVLQIETGFKSSDFKNVNLKNSEILENKISYTIRYGLLLNKLEVFIDGSYNKNEITAIYERKKHKIDEIISKIKNSGMEINDISTDDGNLEDVFIDLTKS